MTTIFHTDCFSPKVADILTRLRDRSISSGTKQLKTSFAVGSVKLEPNGEVVWAVSDGSVGLKIFGSSITTYFSYSKSTYQRKGLNQQKIKEYLAIMLKQSAITALHAQADAKFPSYGDYEKRTKWVDEQWNRDNQLVVNGFSGKYLNIIGESTDNLDGDITVMDIYCFYDKLLNRKRLLKSYTKRQMAKIIGVERDPFATELENIRREETAKLKANHEAALSQIASTRRITLEEAQKKIYAEFQAIEAQEKAAYKIASDALVNSLAFAQNLG